MKIALVAQHAIPLRPRTGSGPDSDDIGLTQLSRMLAGHGHQVTVYAQKHAPDLPDLATLDAGVRVEHITVGPVPRAAAAGRHHDADLLQRVPAFSGPLRRRWRRERPDVVHALLWTSGLAALAAARDLGIPVVQEFSSLCVAERRDRAAAGDGEVRGGASAARIRLEPAIGRSAAAVVTTNSAELSDLAHLGVRRSSIRVVPWGVDTETFAPEGPVARRNGRPRLLTLADLGEREALQTLLRALTRVPGAELMIVGGPPRAELPRRSEYAGLAGFAAALGVSGRVVFTGKVEHRTLPALLRSADLVVSTCTYEPSGATSLRAMACGTPVVAYRRGSMPEVVDEGVTGYLARDVESAISAVPRAVRLDRAAVHARAVARFGADRMVEDYLRTYEALLRSASTSPSGA